eukprot:CAMPEP_0180659178 /NCGR_PEP_ID=MMETSP1037_2-20121125/57429_1 /TAXON_ID=632150 /ORGANISM="Azadinium spinosum, Strain 3D9" /LENGTH=34 /DNA_ID= /DNA_START= /DNA_END= /DNA_ORIENTATION=
MTEAFCCAALSSDSATSIRTCAAACAAAMAWTAA